MSTKMASYIDNHSAWLETAPSVFNLSEDANSRSIDTSVAVECCPLCRIGRHALFCADCVKNGQCQTFRHKYYTFDSFTNGMRIKDQRVARNMVLAEKIAIRMKSHYENEEQQLALRKQKERLGDLKRLIDVTTDHISNKLKTLSFKQGHCRRVIQGTKKIKDRLTSLDERRTKLKKNIESKKQDQQRKEAELSERRKQLLNQLNDFVFHLERVPLSGYLDSSDSVSAELADATSLTFVRGHWAVLEQDSYRIVNITLPASGQYIGLLSYIANVADEKATGPAQILHQVREEWAGLVYAKQFAQIIAKILDIHMPYGSALPILNVSMITVEEFTNFVAQLNFNIAYLACSQSHDMTSFHPKHTLHNLLSLISKPVHGRSCPFALASTSLLESVESEITRHHIPDNNALETPDDIDEDWSLVNEAPAVDLPTMSASRNYAGELMTSAVSVVSSLWPFK